MNCGVVNSAGGNVTDELDGKTISDEGEIWTAGSTRLDDSNGVSNLEIRDEMAGDAIFAGKAEPLTIDLEGQTFTFGLDFWTVKSS